MAFKLPILPPVVLEMPKVFRQLVKAHKSLAELFGVSKSTVSEHLNNIFSSDELEKESTVRNFRTVQKEGNRAVKRNIEFYNLDAIISVGYRVNSAKATQFRIWATQTIKQYITQGYAVNKKQLKQTRNKV